jgi:hypothetical protein
MGWHTGRWNSYLRADWPSVEHQLRLVTSGAVQLTMAIREECRARDCTGGQLFVSL